MSRYIDADELIISIKKECPMCELNQSCDSCMVTEEVKDIHRFADLHRTDVKPVVRGEWVTYDRKELIPTGKISIDEHGNPYKVREWGVTHWFRCSNCKYVEEVKTPFCCECGADMRGEQK